MTAEFFPEQTIKYKTYVKRTMVEALTKVFANHPDELLQRTKASIEYPKTEVDFPCVVIKFIEKSVYNAGVAHEESIRFAGESDSIEVSANVVGYGGVTLRWPSVNPAASYKVYKVATATTAAQSFTTTGTEWTDTGRTGRAESVNTVVSANLDPPQPTTVVVPNGNLGPGIYTYRVTALLPTQAIRFKHYFYKADIEFGVYGLSSLDRDLVADTLVQMIAMGDLDLYTENFFERVYPDSEIFPDSQLHFMNVNSDVVQTLGESESQVPWGAEDDLLYTVAYRVEVFGELYSLPPKLSYHIVRQVVQYPYVGGFEPVPTGDPADTGVWMSNS